MKLLDNYTSKQIAARLNLLKNWQAALILFALGAATFSSGLTGDFQGDDFDQIVDNQAVHSVANIGMFFQSSTFWNGHQLVGDFYRPMMTTVFSLIYSIFGAQPVAFHMIQLLLYLAAAFMLYLFLKQFFKPLLALLTVALLVIHPINSQIVYSIPTMQEALFFLPGISALYVLTRSQSLKALFLAVGLLFVALLAKETAIVFVVLALGYLFLFHRTSVWTFAKLLIAPVVIYLVMRLSAVGITHLTHAAPIDQLSFWQRLLTMPSLITFYLQHFFAPGQQATIYYWTRPTFTVAGVLLPLIIVLAVCALLVAAGMYLKRQGTAKQFTLYVFFCAWLILGVAPYLQLIPLDMTACETWFYVAQVGLMGVLLIIGQQLFKDAAPRYLILGLAPCVAVIGILTTQSFVRGFDYRSQKTIALADIAIVPNNYYALNNLGRMNIRSGNLNEARSYVERSIAAYPTVSNYNNLGVIAQKQGNLLEARQAYEHALQYVKLAATYENLAIIYSATESSQVTIDFLRGALQVYPTDTKLLTFLALHQAALGQRDQTIGTLNTVYRLHGAIPQSLVVAVQTGQALDVPVSGTSTVIHIPAMPVTR